MITTIVQGLKRVNNEVTGGSVIGKVGGSVIGKESCYLFLLLYTRYYYHRLLSITITQTL